MLLPCSFYSFWVCLSATTFCCFILLPAIPAPLQPPAFSDPEGEAATSFALSLLLSDMCPGPT